MSAGRRRAAHALFAFAFVLAGLAVVVPSFPSTAQAVDDTGVTRSVTAVRTHVDADGAETRISSNKVTLEVDQVSNLRGRQEIHVEWSGAVPTGGVVADPNSSEGRNQEYPFVLLQCRGVDTVGKAPKGQDRLSPETCWTQTATERYLAAASHTPSWRFDAHAAAADRRAVVGAPETLPEKCDGVSEPLSARWLPFRANGGKVYHGGPDPSVGCTGLPPESDSAEAGGLPSNTTYGVTGTDGRGAADFAVWTAAENASLGCSATVSCALVAVPIVGLSCDAHGTRLPGGGPQLTKAGAPLSETQLTNADTTCRRTGAYAAGAPRASETTDQAVRGNLWWSASNWRNRITVPLDFALTGAACDAMSAEAPERLMGSVVLNELTASWRPKFCTTDSLFTFSHVQQADSLARMLVNVGEVDAAFTSAPEPGGYSRPVVQAPTAFGGFAISFNIDDIARNRRTSLNLNARLVAKLLSSSYPAVAVMRDNHPSIGANPLNITLDPEFQALNPGLPATSNLEAAAALQVFATSSDLVWALTSWLDADPEARTWLDGYADPWGMKVNEAYRGVELPVDNWPLLDTYVAPKYYQENNSCYEKSPTPFMQLIASPASNLAAVLLNMQFASSAVTTVCKFDGYDETTRPLRPQGRQSVGYRFVMGLTSLSAARRFNLNTAALQTASTVAPGKRFEDATGRTFVQPSTSGLTAAAALLKPDRVNGMWNLDYSALRTAEGAGAYPGALPVYTVIPTEGLEAGTATRLAKFLCYAGGQGQKPGLSNGQLPPGYLPITARNGLGAQRDYLLSSTAAVRAQAGGVPALDAVAPTRSAACDFRRKPAAAPSPSPTESPTDDPTPIDVPAVSAPLAPAVPVASVEADPAAVSPVTDAPAMLTAGQSSALAGFGPLGLLLFALAAALVGVLVRWYDVILAACATAGSDTRSAARAAVRSAAAGRSRRRGVRKR